MAVFERETRVAAPFDEVWAFHSRVQGLEALTPGWLCMRVERVRGPEGERDPDVLEAGSEVTLSIQPFGVGPRQSWTSRIVERVEAEGSALFRDEMVAGPFRRWVHTHAFYEDDGWTRVRDRVEYAFPGGEVGQTLSPLARVGLEPMFRYRHRRTHELLEADAPVRGL